MYVDIRWSNIADGRSDQFQTYRLVSLDLKGQLVFKSLSSLRPDDYWEES